VFISPAVVGNAVMIGSCAGTLYALDRTKGTPIWSYDTKADGEAAQFHGELLLIGDTIVVPTNTDGDGNVYAFDVRTGDLRWKATFKFGVATAPLLVSGRVIVAAANGDVAAIEPKTGKIAWKVSPAGPIKQSPNVPSPAAIGDRILVADNTGKMFGLDASSGKTVWTTPLAALPNTSLTVIGKSVVVGTVDNFLNWIEPGSGAITRRTRLTGFGFGTVISAPPLLLVLVKGSTAKLVALDAETGALRWEKETPREWETFRPLVTGSVVIAGNEEKEVCAFNRSDGALRWCRSIGQIPRGLGTAGDTLYVGTLSGKVQVYRIAKTDTQ
jgi:outer membrane protein assembly factor BamB